MRWQRCHLTTHAARVFSGELETFLLMARDEQDDPLNLKGSFAGAMGYGQLCRRLTNNTR